MDQISAFLDAIPVVGVFFQLIGYLVATIPVIAPVFVALAAPIALGALCGIMNERSGVVKAYLAKHPEIVTEDFPGYAPDANPDEGVWGYTKYHRLPNYAPEDTHELRSRLCNELSSLRRRPDLLASFIRHAGIPRCEALCVMFVPG